MILGLSIKSFDISSLFEASIILLGYFRCPNTF
jgi:hypothetical protein